MVSENVRKTFKLCPCAWYPARKKKPERVTQMTWLKSKCKTTLFSRTIDFDQPLPRFWPKEKCPKSLLVLLGRNAKTIIFDTKCCLFLDHFHSVSFWHTQKKPCSIYLPISGPPRSSWDIMVAQAVFCRSLIKVKFFIDQVRPALGSVGWLSPCSKSLKIALFQTFSSWHPNTFYPTALYWPGTAFYWPSTTKYQIVPGPVPSHINQYHPTLTHYHQEPIRTALYWPISTTYQPIPPHTDPVSPSTNQHRPILTHYYHKPTSTALYWPSTTKYQPVPPHTDPLPPQTNQYRPILPQYHQVPTNTAPYWPITTTNQPVLPDTDQAPPSTIYHHIILPFDFWQLILCLVAPLFSYKWALERRQKSGIFYDLVLNKRGSGVRES